ncbi:MAG: MFS transporter [Burkholderiales bacterium]|nr:MFS transporter [Burkholderiales bacterium]
MRNFLIGLAAFLTLVDLFATQAILPALAQAYGVGPAAMGLAVNASTLGMAVGALAVAFFSRRIDRRLGTVAALALLAIPTALLAGAPDLATFAALRIAQGLCMATAFALTLSYLAEHCSAQDSAGAFAAYIAGNVASNLVGRLVAAGLVDQLGIAASFYGFALLNLAGALLVWFWLGRAAPAPMVPVAASPLAAWAAHLRNPALRASFAIGFLILFAFIGTFTYVNFVLVREPLALSMMAIGFVYFVFLPAIVATPLAGRVANRVGARGAFWGAIGVALAGAPLLLAASVPAVLAGMVLVGAGTFFAQATATGFVGRAATADRGSASGIYLASYFAGGLAGSAVLGQLFDRLGWAACVAGIAAALALAAILGSRLTVAVTYPEPAQAHAT